MQILLFFKLLLKSFNLRSEILNLVSISINKSYLLVFICSFIVDVILNEIVFVDFCNSF